MRRQQKQSVADVYGWTDALTHKVIPKYQFAFADATTIKAPLTTPLPSFWGCVSGVGLLLHFCCFSSQWWTPFDKKKSLIGDLFQKNYIEYISVERRNSFGKRCRIMNEQTSLSPDQYNQLIIALIKVYIFIKKNLYTLKSNTSILVKHVFFHILFLIKKMLYST